MTRCSVHPEYDGTGRPHGACGACSLLYMNAVTDRYLELEWKILKDPANVRKPALQPLRTMSAAAGLKAS